MKKKKIEDHGVYKVERVEHTEISETYDIQDLYEIENNDELIRIEMNTIEFPLFTKNKKIKDSTIITYEFNNMKNQYLKVTPLSGKRIPGEFEEKMFFAMMKMYKENGHDQIIYTDFYTLISEMRLNYSGIYLRKAKEALEILSGTSYQFNNLFYSNEAKGIINDNIMTNMFTVRRIELKEAKKVENKEMLKYFRNSKIKEIIQIKFTGYFYENVIRKGYLYFDRQDLLQIESSVSRTIYMMLTKWRNEDLYIKRYSKFLASRIPLSWKKNNISATIKILNASFEDLKNKELIHAYKFHDENGYDTSYFEIWFEEKHNKKYQKKLDEITHDTLEITGITNETNIDTQEHPIYEQDHIKQAKELLALMPDKARELKTLQKKLENYLKKYGYEYVRDAVLYTSKNAKKSFGKYFDGCIKENWHEEFAKANLKKNSNKIIPVTDKKAEKAIKAVAESKKEAFAEKEKKKVTQAEYDKEAEKYLRDAGITGKENIPTSIKISLKRKMSSYEIIDGVHNENILMNKVKELEERDAENTKHIQEMKDMMSTLLQALNVEKK